MVCEANVSDSVNVLRNDGAMYEEQLKLIAEHFHNFVGKFTFYTTKLDM
jgi:hypothetical protein